MATKKSATSAKKPAAKSAVTPKAKPQKATTAVAHKQNTVALAILLIGLAVIVVTLAVIGYFSNKKVDYSVNSTSSSRAVYSTGVKTAAPIGTTKK
jgi:hypothetical protein